MCHGRARAAVSRHAVRDGCSGCAIRPPNPAQLNERTQCPVYRAPLLVAFLAGGAVGLAAHESGHLLLHGVLRRRSGLRQGRVPRHPVLRDHPQRICRRARSSRSSAGFWVQQATNEWLLTPRPHLRDERAPFAKGVFAFNVLASVALCRRGVRAHRTDRARHARHGDVVANRRAVDRRVSCSPASSIRWRYFHPDARWAVWASRAVKVGGVLF